MIWTHLLPPDTRAAGTVDPANDANAFTEAFSAMGAGFNVQNPMFSGGADPTGSSDSSVPFATAVAALAGNPGALFVPPGTYKIASSSIAFGNPGQWLVCSPGVTFMSYLTGDCISATFAGTYSGTTTRDGGIIGGPVIDGTNAGAGSSGIHVGDMFNYRTDVVVRFFTGTGSKGAWFDNRHNWTEGGHFKVDAIGCQAGVVFDVNGGTNSFARMYADLYVNTQNIAFDGVVFQSSATPYGSLIKIGGNYANAASGTAGASLRLAGTSAIRSSFLFIDNETNSNTVTAQSVNFASGSNVIDKCLGVMNFSAGSGSFAASNWAGSGSFLGPITGDSSLAGLCRLSNPVTLDAGLNTGHGAAAQALATGNTITTAGLTTAQVTNTAAVTGIIMQAGTFDGQEITVLNRSGNSITFAAASSNVSDGSSDVIAATSARRFVWSASGSLWYPSK